MSFPRSPRLNSAPSNVPSARFKVTPSLKHKHQKSLNTPQLDLYNREPSLHRQASDRYSAETFLLEPIYATPSVCRQPGGRCWWNLRCSHSNRFFIGLYSIQERDHIIQNFKERRHRIEPRQFAVIADQAIAFYTAEAIA